MDYARDPNRVEGYVPLFTEIVETGMEDGEPISEATRHWYQEFLDVAGIVDAARPPVQAVVEEADQNLVVHLGDERDVALAHFDDVSVVVVSGLGGVSSRVDGLDEAAMADICAALDDRLDYFSLVEGSSATLGASVHIVPPMGMAPMGMMPPPMGVPPPPMGMQMVPPPPMGAMGAAPMGAFPAGMAPMGMGAPPPGMPPPPPPPK